MARIQPSICKIGNPDSDAQNEKSCNDTTIGATDARDACNKVEEKKKGFLEEVGNLFPGVVLAKGIANFFSTDSTSSLDQNTLLIFILSRV